MQKDCIIICEAQCWGIEHASFNAALLHTVQIAYPNTNIIFLGEKDHLTQMHSVLKHNGIKTYNIEWRDFLIYRRNAPKWKRLINDLSWCNVLINISQQVKAKLLVICSINNTGILALKTLMHIRQFKIPTSAIPHSCLADLLINKSWLPWSMRNALAFPPPGNLSLMTLGESIYNEVIKLQPKHKEQWINLDLPCLWPEISRLQREVDSNKIQFGFLGSANVGKGFDLFCKLADEIGQKYSNADFLLVGFYYGFNASSPNSIYVEGVSDQPLSVDEFQRRANGMTYSVWLAHPEHYRLTASATFIDSLAYLKPGIYLRNPYVEHYVQRMGDIGYLCDTFEDVLSTIRGILDDFPLDRYKQQVENIKKGRMIFEPKNLSNKLKQQIFLKGEIEKY
jgi:hypothetical protein